VDQICSVAVSSLVNRRHQIACLSSSNFYDATVRCSVDPKSFGDEIIGRIINGKCSIAFDNPDNDRQYFFLESASGGSLVCAQRNVLLQGSVNFRDIGGYLTESGKRIAWGKIFRSGHLSNLTALGKIAFAKLDVGLVVDFRLSEEKASENAQLPGDPTVCQLGITPGIGTAHYFHDLFATKPSEIDVVEAMQEMMRYLVTDNIEAYSQLFQLLLHSDKSEVLLNCSAGKERTGLGVALLLECLGVPRETVLYDFMLSKKYFPVGDEIDRVLQKYGVSNENGEGVKIIMPLLETRESYLNAAFDYIDKYYGCTKAFAKQCLGLGDVDFVMLQNKYTD